MIAALVAAMALAFALGALAGAAVAASIITAGAMPRRASAWRRMAAALRGAPIPRA